MIIRKADINDIELLIKLRFDYLTDDRGSLTQDEKAKIEEQLNAYLPRHISNNTFIGMLAEEDGEILSSAYLAISEKPANPVFITGKTGTLLNVFTYPQYRRQGIAEKVVRKIIGEAMDCGVCSIDLSATSSGKPLYKKLGFHESNYTAMSLKIL